MIDIDYNHLLRIKYILYICADATETSAFIKSIHREKNVPRTNSSIGRIVFNLGILIFLVRPD